MSENPELGTWNSELKIGLLAGDLSHRHGWAHYSLSLIEALRDAGAALTVVAARNSPDVPGVTLHRLLPNVVPAERWLLLKQAWALPPVRALLRDCDVIHALLEPYAPLAAGVAGSRPLLITAHGSYVRLASLRPWPVSAIYGWALRRGTLVCVSRHTARVASASLSGARTVVVNNGVDAARFAALTPTPLPQGQGLQNVSSPPLHFVERRAGGEVKTILTVGAVKARKGILELARALAVVRRELPETRCVVIGSLTDTAYVGRVRAEIHTLGLDDHLLLLGHVPEDTLLAWYGAADVFVLPSVNDGWKFEGYGLVYLEASAAGLPVIGTTDTGAVDAIDNGVTGLLVAQDRLADDLPRAMLRLLRDPDLRARMGAAGRARAQAQTWARVAGQMLALYTDSLTHRTKP
ncbi:MAG: glycosyltransferase family 4 protein [Chloroflexi bacterium]|nr:glycosyltransferase family 4 protein [Chloroflexota bacterium]